MLECMELKIMPEWAFIVLAARAFCRQLSLSLSLSLPDFDAAGQATTRLAKRCSQKERGKEEATARDISVLETGNVMGRFSRWILAAFFEILEHIYMCVLRNWYYFNEQEQ